MPAAEHAHGGKIESVLDSLPMPRERSFRHRMAKASPALFQLSADVAAVVSTMVVFYLLRLRESTFHPAVRTPEFFWSVLAAAVVYWIGLFWLAGLYRNWLVRSPFDEAFAVLKAISVGGAIPIVAMLLDSGWFSSKLVAYTLLVGVTVIAFRYGVRRIQLRFRAEGIITFPTLLVGDAEGVAEFLAQFDRHTRYGYVLIGVVCERQDVGTEDVPVVGTPAEFSAVLARLEPAVCILAFRHADHDRIVELVNAAAERNAQVMIVPDLYHAVMGTVRALSLHGVSLIEVSPHLLKPWQALVKRAMDITVSAVVLIAGLPLWLLIALAIKLDSPGPVLYTQYRVGRGNRPFKLYKFRSMTHGRWDGTWTQLNDPRVTRVGGIIRRLYLDEIPQFWNVLKGDMSLVGPRPEQVSFVERFSQAIPYYARRHIVRPGMTGWWQVRRQRSIHADMLQEIRSRLQDDFYYIENISLRLDIEIIIRTIVVIVRGQGIA